MCEKCQLLVQASVRLVKDGRKIRFVVNDQTKEKVELIQKLTGWTKTQVTESAITMVYELLIMAAGSRNLTAQSLVELAYSMRLRALQRGMSELYKEIKNNKYEVPETMAKGGSSVGVKGSHVLRENR